MSCTRSRRGGRPNQPRLNSCSRGRSAICSGTTCSAKIERNIALLNLNGTHARAYAAMRASVSGMIAAGIEMTNELMKYGRMPPGMVSPPVMTSL